jgi:7,8-dihydropterin-6-yl-methyl-4-(beta-D-ribofuranosyl)aminobenzene 5'-phosphate synthase
MTDLLPVDSVEIRILVDNVTDNLSSVPSFVETEWAFHWRSGMKAIEGACICCAAHGLSCLITVKRGDASRTLLFDTGPDGQVLTRNARLLKVDFAKIDALMLSHGHWDHGGGILRALDLIRAAGKTDATPVHMHPDMFSRRATRGPGGDLRPMRDVPKPADIAKRGGEAVLERAGYATLDGLFWVSGEVPRTTDFERGVKGQIRRVKKDKWEPDETMLDERALYVDVKGLGLVVFTACSHAGVVNVLRQARARFPDRKLHCVLGGFHLSGNNEAIIPQTVAEIKTLGPRYVAAGHCTGWRAINALTNAFGDGVVAPLAVGKRIAFAA